MNISEISEQALGKWEHIFNALGIETGRSKHCLCLACEGKGRFRFDNQEGRGTYICNQCGEGDGLDLIKERYNCDIKEAVNKVM